jgi:glycosidase
MKFHISAKALSIFGEKQPLSPLSNYHEITYESAQLLANKIQGVKSSDSKEGIYGSELYVIGLINEIFHNLMSSYLEKSYPNCLHELWKEINSKFAENEINNLLTQYLLEYPPGDINISDIESEKYIKENKAQSKFQSWILKEVIFQWVENENPAYQPYRVLFSNESYSHNETYSKLIKTIDIFFSKVPPLFETESNLFEVFQQPSINEPDSIIAQLQWIMDNLGEYLGHFNLKMLRGLDFLKEDHKFHGDGPGPQQIISFGDDDFEAYSKDADWMSNVIIMAKNIYVWLVQLSKVYNRKLTKLSDIPNEELDKFANSGFTSLWLIGIWERSPSSKLIKQLCGNPDAESSAYALFDYKVAWNLGGDNSLADLDYRCNSRGIKLACDMVPNHTGIDSKWTRQHPEWYIQNDHPPFPSYSFNGENLSSDENIGIYLEDHYYDRTDAAVVFNRIDFRTGDTRFIYHGNDGTSMPWNDTAQLNYLMPEVREAVIETIIDLAKQFRIIRFDAAMTLAKKHFQRLWFPQPGTGSDIASRSIHGVDRAEFDQIFPVEFWREVVDRIAKEVPDTLLLAEAFWMMEGYFVRTLGMHRVYNSAFMNMLKLEDNSGYRQSIINVLKYDPEILKRFVNFLNNPDEEPAAVQFGKGDKYFGVTTMMITMPGTPMFGHGQIEGFSEKYGMEYSHPYQNENLDQRFIDRHKQQVFPIMKKRRLFSESQNFRFYDFIKQNNEIDENVFAYSNRIGDDSAIVLFNNCWERTSGRIHNSVHFHSKSNNSISTTPLFENINSQGIKKFLIFKDHPKEHYYIRKSSDIIKDGFYADLVGYQCQLFFFIETCDDDDNNNLSSLCEVLDGSAVTNLEAELKSANFRDVHRKMADLVTILKDMKIMEIKNQKIEFVEHIDNLFSILLSQVNSALSLNISITKVDVGAEFILKFLSNFVKINKLKHSWDDKYLTLPGDKIVKAILSAIITLLFYKCRLKSIPINEFRSLFDLSHSRFATLPEKLIPIEESDLKIIFILLSYNPKSSLDTVEFSKLFDDKIIKDYLKVNEYQGTTWFDYDKLQRFLTDYLIISSLNEIINSTREKQKDNASEMIFTDHLLFITSIDSLAVETGYKWKYFIDKLNKTEFENENN